MYLKTYLKSFFICKVFFQNYYDSFITTIHYTNFRQSFDKDSFSSGTVILIFYLDMYTAKNFLLL